MVGGQARNGRIDSEQDDHCSGGGVLNGSGDAGDCYEVGYVYGTQFSGRCRCEYGI